MPVAVRDARQNRLIVQQANPRHLAAAERHLRGQRAMIALAGHERRGLGLRAFEPVAARDVVQHKFPVHETKEGHCAFGRRPHEDGRTVHAVRHVETAGFWGLWRRVGHEG